MTLKESYLALLADLHKERNKTVKPKNHTEMWDCRLDFKIGELTEQCKERGYL